jgi:hypothetical protein
MQSKVECRLTCNNCNATVYATEMGRYGNHVILFTPPQFHFFLQKLSNESMAVSKANTLKG